MVVYASNVSRGRNHSFNHILRFLRFLNGNWHKTMVWQIQQPMTIIVCLHQSSLWLVDVISVLYHWKRKSLANFILLLFFSRLHVRGCTKIDVYNFKIFLQFESNCKPNCTDVHRLLLKQITNLLGKKNPFLLLFCTIYKILTFCTVITSHICFSESILKKNIFIAYRSASLCLFIKISIDVRVIPSWAGNM